jgi:hypothetical protein
MEKHFGNRRFSRHFDKAWKVISSIPKIKRYKNEKGTKYWYFKWFVYSPSMQECFNTFSEIKKFSLNSSNKSIHW